MKNALLLLLLLASAGCSSKSLSTAPEPDPGPETTVTGERTETAQPVADNTAAVAPASAAEAVAAEVVASARQALGKPYLYGGTGQGEAGFDCSGLIRYVYAQQGIALPRVSTAQATQGVAVEKSLDALAPGDILTFAGQPGGTKVSHVGLYLGDGRFIHSSSSKGVMESALSASDPYGQWWVVRWVGARRVIGQ